MRMIIVAIIILNWEIMAHRVFPPIFLLSSPIFYVAYFFAVISVAFPTPPFPWGDFLLSTAVYSAGFVC